MLDYSSTPDVFQCRLWYAVIEFTNSPLLIRGDKSMINSFNLVRFIYTSVSLLLLIVFLDAPGTDTQNDYNEENSFSRAGDRVYFFLIFEIKSFHPRLPFGRVFQNFFNFRAKSAPV